MTRFGNFVSFPSLSGRVTFLSACNCIPPKSRGTDFSRLREWMLDGHAKFARQTVVLCGCVRACEICSVSAIDRMTQGAQVRQRRPQRHVLAVAAQQVGRAESERRAFRSHLFSCNQSATSVSAHRVCSARARTYRALRVLRAKCLQHCTGQCAEEHSCVHTLLL